MPNRTVTWIMLGMGIMIIMLVNLSMADKLPRIALLPPVTYSNALSSYCAKLIRADLDCAPIVSYSCHGGNQTHVFAPCAKTVNSDPFHCSTCDIYCGADANWLTTSAHCGESMENEALPEDQIDSTQTVIHRDAFDECIPLEIRAEKIIRRDKVVAWALVLRPSFQNEANNDSAVHDFSYERRSARLLVQQQQQQQQKPDASSFTLIMWKQLLYPPMNDASGRVLDVLPVNSTRTLKPVEFITYDLDYLDLCQPVTFSVQLVGHDSNLDPGQQHQDDEQTLHTSSGVYLSIITGTRRMLWSSGWSTEDEMDYVWGFLWIIVWTLSCEWYNGMNDVLKTRLMMGKTAPTTTVSNHHRSKKNNGYVHSRHHHDGGCYCCCCPLPTGLFVVGIGVFVVLMDSIPRSLFAWCLISGSIVWTMLRLLSCALQLACHKSSFRFVTLRQVQRLALLFSVNLVAVASALCLMQI